MLLVGKGRVELDNLRVLQATEDIAFVEDFIDFIDLNLNLVTFDTY